MENATYQLSRKRLENLPERLHHEPEVLREYDSFIKEQLHRGIIEDVEKPSEGGVGQVHYILHHAVIRRDKLTTKHRVVFDASAFLMVGMVEEDRDVLRFPWVDAIDKPSPEIVVLRFTHVVFGV